MSFLGSCQAFNCTPCRCDAVNCRWLAEARLVKSPIVPARHRLIVGPVLSWQAPLAVPSPPFVELKSF